MNSPVRNTSSPKPAGINPFAQAMKEARGAGDQAKQNDFMNQNGGSTNGLHEYSDSLDAAEQQRLIEEQQKRERLRQKLHAQINPVETHDIFNARQENIKKEIDNIRYELKMLVQEVAEFHKEVDLTLMTNVAEPGQEGKYYLSFFQKLRAFIMLLRQKIHSARTWATTMQSKKKKQRKGAGMEINGQQYEQTKTVFDHMHHERSNSYSGS